MNLLQIRAADAAGGHLHQQFARPDLGHGHRLHAHVVDAAVDHGAHGGGNLALCDAAVSGLEVWVAIRVSLMSRPFVEEVEQAIPQCFGKPFCYSRPSGRVQASTKAAEAQKV